MTDNMKPVRCGCGGEAKVGEVRIWGKYYAVKCYECGIETDPQSTEAEAVAAWNRAMGNRYKLSRFERTAKATRKPEAFFYRCEYGYGLCCEKNDMNYCPHCGCRLEWE